VEAAIVTILSIDKVSFIIEALAKMLQHGIGLELKSHP
jgi:hypothetical protein